MATWIFVLYSLIVSLALSSAAPNGGANILKVPKDCENERFCPIKPAGYDDLLKEFDAALPSFLIEDYNQRVGRDEDVKYGLSPKSDWINCPYITQRQQMYQIRNENQTDFDTVVQTLRFTQKITTVRCAYDKIPKEALDKEECFINLHLSANGLKSSCRTTYATQGVYVYDRKTSRVIRKEYPIPVCCSCVLDSV